MNTNTVNNKENEIDNTAELWVQKYKPIKYLDLLSDESTNRVLLHWLKLWDKVVFNKEVHRKNKSSNYVYDKSAGWFFILLFCIYMFNIYYIFFWLSSFNVYSKPMIYRSYVFF